MTVTTDDAVVAALQVIQSGFIQKNFLLRVFTAYLLEHGQYNYTVALDDLQELEGYALLLEYKDDAVHISIKFPEEFNFDGDPVGALH